MSAPKILILGGGKAGSQVAAEVLKSLPSAELTLVDARDKAYHMIAAPRAMVDPARVKPESLHVPVSKLFRNGKGKFVKGLVSEVKEREAVLEDGTVIPFDYLVVALGANYGAPLKYEVSKTSDEVVAAQREIAAAISAASTVAIVGGGPNGLEIAFEITEKYGKTKTVTLIHAGEKLLDRVAGLDPKVPQVALERCKEAGIEVILGERAELSDGLRFKGWAAQQTLKTDKGREIQADVVLAVTGNSGFNSSPLKSLNPNVITAKGDIDTLPTLQIKGFPHMFAFGDVSSQSVNKQAAETSFQLSTLVANLKAVVSGKPATKEVKPSSDAFIVVSMGSKGGFGQTPFGVLSGKVGGWMIKQIKGKDLFLTNAWKTYTGAGIPA